MVQAEADTDEDQAIDFEEFESIVTSSEKWERMANSWGRTSHFFTDERVKSFQTSAQLGFIRKVYGLLTAQVARAVRCARCCGERGEVGILFCAKGRAARVLLGVCVAMSWRCGWGEGRGAVAALILGVAVRVRALGCVRCRVCVCVCACACA